MISVDIAYFIYHLYLPLVVMVQYIGCWII